MIKKKTDAPTYDEKGNYREPRYYQGKLLGWRICRPGTEGYIPPPVLNPKRKKQDTIPMILPIDAAARKHLPIFSRVLRYFPRALAEVAAVSRAGSEQHNPGKPLHWDRAKSPDELDALTRHLMEAGTLDSDGLRHSAKVAWRALANLEKELEAAAKEA